MSATEFCSGYVKSINLDRGFGFIAAEHDIFFHVDSLDESLDWDESLEQRRVLFRTITTSKGGRLNYLGGGQICRPSKSNA